MKLKLSRSQFLAMYNLYANVLLYAQPDTAEAKLFFELMKGVYKKLHVKSIDIKKKYSLALTKAEAISHYLFFQNYQFRHDMVYEQNFINQTNFQIHKTFSL